MKIIPRLVQPEVEKKLNRGKVVVLYGARQVGKTTLVKSILEHFPEKSLYLNGEYLSVQERLSVNEAASLKSYLGDNRLVVIDEAQKIDRIGTSLKILVDAYPEMQIIATGSSSFGLANKASEPLTGRVDQFTLYPLSLEELEKAIGRVETEARLENLLRFGSYPEVALSAETEASYRLNEISANYLYKDVLSFEGMKKSSLVSDLLRLIALQLGQEVSYQELAAALGVSRPTIQKYLNLLEQSFVIFTLRSFSRNLRKEISKSIKIYFFDLGIRNSLIQNYNSLSLRNDLGALWENFLIVERLKADSYRSRFVNRYFWRTYDQKEIDYLEERGGKLRAFEFKWSDKVAKVPKEFLKTYTGATFTAVTRKNYWDFLKGS